MTDPANTTTVQEPMPRHVRIGLLLDLYGNLLTERQREFVILHYDEDQSFGEIALGKGVSRQAVHDAVKHAEKSLEQYERKLRLLERGIPGILARIEKSPLPKDGEGPVEGDGLPSDEWMIEALEREAPAGGDGEDRPAPRREGRASGSAAPSNLSEILTPVADGLTALRKRILRSGGIIYDGDGLLADVNRLLNRVNELCPRQPADQGGSQDV